MKFIDHKANFPPLGCWPWRWQCWEFFFWSLVREPPFFPLAITNAVYGYPFRKVMAQIKVSARFDDSGGWEQKNVKVA